MPHVIHNIKRVSEELVKEFRLLSTATVNEASGGKGALSHRIKPISPQMKVCGPAVTVKVRPCDNLILHKAIYVAHRGDVIIADAEGYLEAGAWGEIMAVAAKIRGIEGFVFNGMVRDSEVITEIGFLIFSCGLSIKGTDKISLGLINHPIIIDNVKIYPGDLVLGDRDGVVIVKREEAEDVLRKSIEREEKEKLIKERLRAGESTLKIYGFEEILRQRGLTEDE